MQRYTSGNPSLPRQWQVAVKVWPSTQCCIYSFWAPDGGRRNRLKHVENFTEINNLCNVASCWLYLKMCLRCTDPWTLNTPINLLYLQRVSVQLSHYQGDSMQNDKWKHQTFNSIIMWQDRQYTYNVILWHVRVMFLLPRLHCNSTDVKFTRYVSVEMWTVYTGWFRRNLHYFGKW
jgi:hypothetical protein